MDLDQLLAKLSDDAPSGVELRNDPRFHAIERLVEPAARSNRMNADGSINLSAPDVDWSDVLSSGEELAQEGRDLRLLTLLIRGLYAEQGFDGLAVGIEFLKTTIERFWDSLHPEKRDRPDAAMAVLPRTNALKQLENDENGLLGDMRFGVVLNQRGIGPIVGDDLARATYSDFDVINAAPSGLSQSEKDALITKHAQAANRVKAATRALAAEEGERAQGLVSAISACIDHLTALESTFNEAAGFGNAPGLSLEELSDFLAGCRKTLDAAIKATDAGTEPPVDEPSTETTMSQTASTTAPATGKTTQASSQPGLIRSRRDVEDALDRIVAFYENTEPSSPIPHLARRLRRMVAMDFMELMEEIAPSGLKEFRNVAGVDEAKKK